MSPKPYAPKKSKMVVPAIAVSTRLRLAAQTRRLASVLGWPTITNSASAAPLVRAVVFCNATSKAAAQSQFELIHGRGSFSAAIVRSL